MDNYIFWTVVLAMAALLSAGLAVFVRAYLGGTTPGALLFRPKAERRLQVVEYASVDSRRKLMLIRRDDVEHLLLTGGPVDVVVETGIAGATRSFTEDAPAKPPAPVRRVPSFASVSEIADPVASRAKDNVGL